jgi:isopentenyl-diphosphate Delta-isomerase
MRQPCRSDGSTSPDLKRSIDEQLILVDEGNRAVGSAGKLAIHRSGLLHRAFSIFMIDARGRVLLQRRHPKKYHSGGLWANSCCGHPRPGEKTVSAARRRLHEELGIGDPLSLGFFARYRTQLDNGMHENEFVYVYFAPLRTSPQPHPAEITDLEYASVADIGRRIKAKPDAFAFWLKHYFQHHQPQIARFARMASG